ncbi:Zn-dependent hydrolase [Thioclava sp. SK-1]|nr:Zn-dependent hydrolase [Thioclava sp. SK-1]
MLPQTPQVQPDRTSTGRIPSHCIALADATPGIEYLHHAQFTDAVPPSSIRIQYIEHSEFLLRTVGGLSVVTDYNGYIGPTVFVPDVVTMNHAHSSHWTDDPPKAVRHVLPGWHDQYGLAADHYLDLGEMLIRNVTTDIRSFGSVEENGNSIFVFEVEGLCVGHLGHLHHEPNAAQYAALGRLDVVMAAVDGSMTVDQATMVRILTRLRSSIVIPMHWFGRGTLDRFLAQMGGQFDIVRPGGSALTVSLSTLPQRPTIVVLEPELLRDP